MPKLACLALAALLGSPLATSAIVVGTQPAYAAAAEFCGYNDARRALPAKQMVFYAEVPRTPKAYRFVVLYKGGHAGATIYVANCKIDTTLNIEKLKPWCLYLPAEKRCHK